MEKTSRPGSWIVATMRPVCSCFMAAREAGRTVYQAGPRIFASASCAVLVISRFEHYGDSSGDHHDVGFSARQDV